MRKRILRMTMHTEDFLFYRHSLVSTGVFLVFSIDADDRRQFIDHAHAVQDGECIAEIALAHGVRDDDQLDLAVLVLVLLHHLCDADIVIAQHTGDTRQYARTILYRHAKEILALDLVNRLDAQALVAGASQPSGTAADQIACGVDDISDDIRGCRELTCAASLEHRVIQCVAVDKDCVERILDGGKRMRLRQQQRIDMNLDLSVLLTGDADQLELASHLPCVLDIGRRDV